MCTCVNNDRQCKKRSTHNRVACDAEDGAPVARARKVARALVLALNVRVQRALLDGLVGAADLRAGKQALAQVAPLVAGEVGMVRGCV